MGQCPFHPKPHKNKASLFTTLFLKRRSWLDGLYEKSYKMKMGRVKMPGLDLHVVNDPKEVRRIMVDEVREFPKSELLHELLNPLLGDSIFTTNDKVWEKQRDLIKPSFEMTRISRVFTHMKNAANDLIEHLDKNKSGSVVEVDEEMTYTTADVIFRTIMSERLDREEGKKVINAFITFQEETARAAMRKMFCFPRWISYFLGEKRRLAAGEEIRVVLSNIIKPRYDAVTNGKEIENEDILSSLLQVVDCDTNERFSFEEILDQVAMLFLAGHETTASSLTWTLYLLSMFQEEQEKAYAEVLEVQGEEEVTIQHIRKMKYLTNIFKEALRLYPPVGFYARESKREHIVMRSKNIKKGSAIVVAPWLIHRHEEFWENPNDFDPKRHENPKEIKKDTYLPFGMGERVCIGQGFAMQESILILSSILKNYKLELEEGFVPDVVGRLTVRSANGMNIILTKREK
ncbi:cytochrome [Poseidonibacter parvus]|uniref:Cytochrome n=1 Tax=Poseidonibacter parvus TaxID=1850254 RepID=A0A1P8KPP3_9BACT|nr:cytochrome P450 [Poseidonibacter parvus]APW66481.1 cytochrome [Poseidonibacter parvus]